MNPPGISENVLPVRVTGLNTTSTNQISFGIFRLSIKEEPEMNGGNIPDNCYNC